MNNTDKGILKRLETLQAFVDRQQPAVVTVTLATGEKITTDPAGMIGLCGQYGLDGIADIQTDSPGYVELCGAMLAVYGGGDIAQH